MGWTETQFFTTKAGTRPTTEELADAFLSVALSGSEKFKILKAAHKTNRRDSEMSSYTLWLYGNPIWGRNDGTTSIVITVLLHIDWSSSTICYKEFGIDCTYGNIPPAAFVAALPESLGNEWDDGQLENIRDHYRRMNHLKKALTPGTKISLGYTIEFTNGAKTDWLEVFTYSSRAGKSMRGLKIPGHYGRVSIGRYWRSQVRSYMPAGSTKPVSV